MNINENKQVISGKHNDRSFTLNDGILEYMGDKWDNEKVKDLIDLCNLLKLEGYTLIDKVPSNKGSSMIFPSLRFYDEMGD